jgi:hypothetical protein
MTLPAHAPSVLVLGHDAMGLWYNLRCLLTKFLYLIILFLELRTFSFSLPFGGKEDCLLAFFIGWALVHEFLGFAVWHVASFK